jgi:ABC-type lipoprotein release transport system permease subunit
VVGSAQKALYVLLGAVGLLLLIACANVANLMLAQMAKRRREISVRKALGAGSLQLPRQFLTESVALAIAGGAAGSLLAVWCLAFIRWAEPRSIPRLAELEVDWRVVALAFAVSLFTGVLFGLAPVFFAARTNVSETLKSEQRGGRFTRDPLKIGLVSLEVAIALVLTVGSGLLFRSFLHLGSVDPGFQNGECPHDNFCATPIAVQRPAVDSTLLVKHYGPGDEARGELYFPFAQRPESFMTLAIRSAQAPGAALISAVRREVAAVDPQQPIIRMRAWDEYLDESFSLRRFYTGLLGAFSFVALAMAALGIYGVISYAVGLRSREIAIRMALGARSTGVQWMIVRQALQLAAIGLVAGILGAFGLTRALRGLLYNVTPTDGFTFTVVVILLTAVAAAASYLPARRATADGSMRALHFD